jgi:hypothetical protein
MDEERRSCSNYPTLGPVTLYVEATAVGQNGVNWAGDAVASEALKKWPRRQSPTTEFLHTTLTNRELTFRSTRMPWYRVRCSQPEESSPSQGSADFTTDTLQLLNSLYASLM